MMSRVKYDQLALQPVGKEHGSCEAVRDRKSQDAVNAPLENGQMQQEEVSKKRGSQVSC